MRPPASNEGKEEQASRKLWKLLISSVLMKLSATLRRELRQTPAGSPRHHCALWPLRAGHWVQLSTAADYGDVGNPSWNGVGSETTQEVNGAKAETSEH